MHAPIQPIVLLGLFPIALASVCSETTVHGGDPSSLTAGHKNVLFLAVDDMKDWVGCMGGYEGVVHTPNIDRLAQSGILFSNAHCPSPKCAPSRAAILSGLRASKTGLYDNKHWWMPNYPNLLTMPLYFKSQGYEVAGAGKIFHHTAGNNPPVQWDDFLRLTFRVDPWFRSNKLNYPWSKVSGNPEGFPFSQVPRLGHENDWGWLPNTDDKYDDAISAGYAVEFLKARQLDKAQVSGAKPFFLACGIFRPHLPWYVPKEFFQQYPLDQVVLPQVLENDLEDIPKAGLQFAEARRGDLEKIRTAKSYRRAIQAYLASITFADYQIGRVLTALEDSGLADHTIVVFWSDHGWHLGEKNHWHKSTLWEEATRVPFIVKDSSCSRGQVCKAAVSLLDIYPTLVALCEESKNADAEQELPNFDGRNLQPLLRNPLQEWDKPVVIEFKRGNAAVRSNRYRYIRYADGSEEFYDHQTDPLEWHNLAGENTAASEVKRLSEFLPKSWAAEAKSKKDFEFDPQEYSWTNKESGQVIRGNN
ncbi:MAG: sulfatase [Planctomycetota bacterium]